MTTPCTVVRRPDNSVSPSSLDTSAATGRAPVQQFRPGDVVEALWGDGEWYPATVEVGNGVDAYIIRWSDGDPSDRVKHARDLRWPNQSSDEDDDRFLLSKLDSIKGTAITGRDLAVWAVRGVASASVNLWKRGSGNNALFRTCLGDEGCDQRSRKNRKSVETVVVSDLLAGRCADDLVGRSPPESPVFSGQDPEAKRAHGEESTIQDGIEPLLKELFLLLDVNFSKALEEEEFTKLREKVAVLRRGAAEETCGALRAAEERALLHKGLPIEYSTFCEYMVSVLNTVEPEEHAQKVIMQQFVNDSRRRESLTTTRKSEPQASDQVHGEAPAVPESGHRGSSSRVGSVSAKALLAFARATAEGTPLSTVEEAESVPASAVSALPCGNSEQADSVVEGAVNQLLLIDADRASWRSAMLAVPP
eukprot:TRINITY_DN7700_c2_g1_i1.p1 TRINITY_DN7700_c2_g1~~TRINITY_DN7700_c2_g1_i1.p1  ORF type:complete len:420 (-),score=73.25 TRINITY_DN7700_c2_g1_i1:140-1399(-)